MSRIYGSEADASARERLFVRTVQQMPTRAVTAHWIVRELVKLAVVAFSLGAVLRLAEILLIGVRT